MKEKVCAHSTVVVGKEQISADLDGEVVILNISNGKYYSLDMVGARIWNLLREPVKVSEIQGALLKEYNVGPQRCEHDLLTLLEKMASEGLIELRDEVHS